MNTKERPMGKKVKPGRPTVKGKFQKSKSPKKLVSVVTAFTTTSVESCPETWGR